MSFIDPSFFEPVLSGILVAAAFPIGALVAIYLPYSASKRALFAAFGAGIFFSATMLLTLEALNFGSALDLVLGFSLGAGAFGLAEHYIRHRKPPKEDEE